MHYRLLSDEGLLKLLQNSDEAALKEIYSRYWKVLYLNALRKIRRENIAEELVQNLFVSLWVNRATADDIRKLSGYLNTALKFQVINFVKSSILREKNTLRSATGSPYEENNSASVLLTHELSRAIDNAIGRLPEKSQHIFRLSRMDNQSVKEIAADLSISEKTVEYHITRSLKIMRVYLKDFIAVDLILFIILNT